MPRHLHARGLRNLSMKRSVLRPTQAGAVLGYGVADLPELRRGIALLRRAFQRVDS